MFKNLIDRFILQPIFEKHTELIEKNLLLLDKNFKKYCDELKSSIESKILHTNVTLEEITDKIDNFDKKNTELTNKIYKNIKYRLEIYFYELYKQHIFLVDGEIRKKFFSNLDSASGLKRKIQQTLCILLKYFNEKCRKNNLPYFICFGTLIGALRHNGFIPWDDDVDVCIFRRDIDKLTEIFLNDKNFFIDECYKIDKFNLQHKYRFKFKKFNLPLFIDIFIIDRTEKSLDESHDIVFSANRKMYKEAVANLQKNSYYKGSKEYDQCKNIMDKYLKKLYEENTINLNKGKNTVWAIDNLASRKNYFGGIEEIFPLTDISFENITCLRQKDFKYFLAKKYGDIYELPDDLGTHSHIKLNSEQIIVLENCLSEFL